MNNIEKILNKYYKNIEIILNTMSIEQPITMVKTVTNTKLLVATTVMLIGRAHV